MTDRFWHTVEPQVAKLPAGNRPAVTVANWPNAVIRDSQYSTKTQPISSDPSKGKCRLGFNFSHSKFGIHYHSNHNNGFLKRG